MVDTMQLAQMKRTLEWQTTQLKHKEQEYHTAELALETAKKNVADLKKKVDDDRRALERMKHDVMVAEDEHRKQAFKDRR